jgi:protein gp37
MTEVAYDGGEGILQGADRLRELEIEIEHGLPSFIAVGQALGEIRTRRLYRLTHPTFEDYCRERWDMNKRYANRLILAAKGPIGPKTEGEARRLRAEQEAYEARPTFNRVNDNIGWARWSWNPVTGCLHTCEYCYARDIANRFYAEGFEPTFHPERLTAPQETKMPRAAEEDPAWRRVFTCSMADLFGKWVPQEWINAVFEQIVAAPQWEFLCLTKFPQRLAKLEWPANVWAGTTVDRQHRVKLAQRHFDGVTAGVKWLSCEPLLEPLKFDSLEMFDWVVIGACTASSGAPEFAPPFDWVVDLYQQARNAGCKVYLKHNLFAGGVAPGMEPVREWPR